MIFSSSLDSSGFFDLAEMAMLEPPAKTGAGLPSLPGSTKRAELLVVPLATTLPSFLAASPIDQCAQPGAMIVAADSEVLPVALPSASVITSLSLM